MKLACDAVVPGLGCDYVAEGDSADAVREAMLAHGGAVHSNLMDGLSPAEMQTKAGEMDGHIRSLIAANN